jgi:hypothetical protein
MEPESGPIEILVKRREGRPMGRKEQAWRKKGASRGEESSVGLSLEV